MNIYTNNSTPKHGLSATNQAPQESENSQNIFQTNQLCAHCGSTDFSIGAGLKPGQMSLRCTECKAFIGYRDIGKLRRLQKLHRQKRLTECLSFIERHAHLSGQAAIFILSEVGQVGGEV
jgi:hypothetical protein